MHPAEAPKPEQVRQELTRILSSVSFSRSKRLSRFLSFVVEQALAGNRGRLKEYVIGVEVFGRQESFDPRLDPIVRVEAGRLRAKLQHYYRNEGRDHGIRIDCMKGCYSPVFWKNAPSANPSREALTVAVLPFADFSPEGNQAHLCAGIADELISLLAQVDGVRVASRTSSFAFLGRNEDVRLIGHHLNVNVVVEGSVRREGDRLRITAQLADARDGFEHWSETREWVRADTFAVQKQFSELIVGHLKTMLPDREAG